MEQTSQRKVIAVDSAWNISELMSRIAKALVSDGPALSLASSASNETVSSRTAIVVKTTGSSGVAKEIGLSASALLSSARASNKFLGAQYGNTWSLLLPLNHIAGINVLIRSLELGTVPTNLIGYQGKFPKADFTAIVPTQLYRALHGDENLLDHLRGAKAVLVGGAALNPELRKSADDSGIRIVETYGSTETSGGCVYEGSPLEGVEISLDDSGLIAIKGSILANGVASEDGWFYTSDLGHWVEEKLVIDGRADDIVISGGENISLNAIERVLLETFPQMQCAAFAQSHPEWGQSIHLAIVEKDKTAEGEIQRTLTEKIGSAAKIKGFHYVGELPTIGIGKINRRALMESFNE